MIEYGGRRRLVECGMLQGGRDLDEENAADFGFDPGSTGIVLVPPLYSLPIRLSH